MPEKIEELEGSAKKLAGAFGPKLICAIRSGAGRTWAAIVGVDASAVRGRWEQDAVANSIVPAKPVAIASRVKRSFMEPPLRQE